jgi:hypothetical protein
VNTNWIKPQACVRNGSCVEIRRHDGSIEIRDSKDPDGAVLRLSPPVFKAWLAAAKGAEFDSLLRHQRPAPDIR